MGDCEILVVFVFGVFIGFGGLFGMFNGCFWYFDEDGILFNV